MLAGPFRFDAGASTEIAPLKWQKVKLPTPQPCRTCVFDPKKLHTVELCKAHPCSDVIWVDAATYGLMRLTRKP